MSPNEKSAVRREYFLVKKEINEWLHSKGYIRIQFHGYSDAALGIKPQQVKKHRLYERLRYLHLKIKGVLFTTR